MTPTDVRVVLDTPVFRTAVTKYNLPNEPWAHCMLDYALTVGRLLEQHSIIYEDDKAHQKIDYRGIAIGKAALHGIDIETLFSATQWWRIERTLERMKLPPLPAWDHIRHWRGGFIPLSGINLTGTGTAQ